MVLLVVGTQNIAEQQLLGRHLALAKGQLSEIDFKLSITGRHILQRCENMAVISSKRLDKTN